MLHSRRSYNGMMVAPHHLAAEAGSRVLAEGGNATEAMIAAASTIAVVYPHMNSLGGDNFWLLDAPGESPTGIDACGGAAAKATIEYYRSRGMDAIPGRGPDAALTVAGAVSGWQMAFEHSKKRGGALPLSRLFEDAIHHAKTGIPAPATLANNALGKLPELRDQPGFADTYLYDGQPIACGQLHKQPAIAETLEKLAVNGLDDFYRGALARSIASDLQASGSPVCADDLARHQALSVEPLMLQVGGHRVYNMPPPTQGLSSLMILGIFERLGVESLDDFNYVHGLIESTKQAFRVRDSEVTDPAYMPTEARQFLDTGLLDKLAAGVNRKIADPWPDAKVGGDTVWLGAIDREGRSVSFIQSIYWEFGSGVILPDTGITWQNRGTSFSLDEQHHNKLVPGRRPFHTIQPALAHLQDGRVMPYGTMGGEGQPQTQAMVFSRYAMGGQDLQQAITAPRWLLGKTWGSDITSLRIENRFSGELYEQLRAAGHDVDIIGDYDEVMGHAGALVRHPNGLIEGASDPRSDGSAATV
ncbi:gamma-glutamyltransferase [Chromatiales bacterium (ex Bugula neritina AB1)]|nr:gamma-glutamyltransferase [Chromatiales bacterium (ex Bugula neritina AB1)]